MLITGCVKWKCLCWTSRTFHPVSVLFDREKIWKNSQLYYSVYWLIEPKSTGIPCEGTWGKNVEHSVVRESGFWQPQTRFTLYLA